MSKTYRATTATATDRKAERRRRALVRAQKAHGTYYPPSQGETTYRYDHTTGSERGAATDGQY